MFPFLPIFSIFSLSPFSPTFPIAVAINSTYLHYLAKEVISFHLFPLFAFPLYLPYFLVSHCCNQLNSSSNIICQKRYYVSIFLIKKLYLVACHFCPGTLNVVHFQGILIQHFPYFRVWLVSQTINDMTKGSLNLVSSFLCGDFFF